MPGEIAYSADASIFAGVPGYRRIVLLAEGCSNPLANAALESDMRQQIQQMADDKVNITDPKIEAWFLAYKAVKIKGERSKVQPGVTALLRRIMKGQGDKIPFVNGLVALTNLVALKHLCPTGAFDFSKIKGPVVLGPAQGDESFTPIANPKTVTTPAGQVVLADQGAKVVICDKWNSKGGLDTAISPEVSSVGIDIDMIIGEHTKQEELLEAAALAASILRTYCGATEIKAYELSKDTPSFSLGGPSTIVLPEVSGGGGGAAAAPTGPAWVQSGPAHEAMGVGAMTGTLVESVLAVLGEHLPAEALEGKDEKLRAALEKAMKRKLNSAINHAYAMGHSTVLEESGPPRQANNPNPDAVKP
jgi:DNA/RNA-binding domain of Phe-tRNA-synthetase-like protein